MASHVFYLYSGVLFELHYVRNHATEGELVRGEAWTTDGKEILS
jgi:hypothetical protein